jgi:hypothetical protein
MQISDGRRHIAGVTFDKVTTKQGASWSNIIQIDLRTEASNLNQEGEFYLDGFGFGNMLQSSSIKGIINKKEIQFSTDLDLYSIIPKSNYNATAYYNVGVPFILHKKYNDYDMFYFNVNPIIQKMMSSEGNDTKHIYPLLGKLLEWVDAKLPEHNFINRGVSSLVTGGVAAFSNASVIGELILESSSAIIGVDTPSIRVNIDGKDLFLDGVSQIIPINVGNVTVKSDRGEINGGSGFYTHTSLNQSSIRFIGHPAILLLRFEDGNTNTTTTISGKEVQINLAKSNVLLRQPTVISKGIIDFDNFYGYGELNNKIRVLGQDLRIEGKLTFNNEYSDKFTIIRGTSLEGNLVYYQQPIYPYNEVGSLANIFALPNIRYILTLLLIFVVFYFYIASKKKSEAPIKTK